MSGRLEGSEWVWKDGEFIRWEDATVHVLSLAVQFGSSVFEGMRAYKTPKGPAIFRLDAHLRRLETSARTYRMSPAYSSGELAAAAVEGVRRNGLQSCYIRPMVLRGFGSPGLKPDLSPIECYIPMWPWGAYLGAGALESGVDVCVSSWHRPAPNTFPSGAKAAGNYNNSQLIAMEATRHGYAEGIALGPSGLVSEGSGQNLFLVMDGLLVTPILDGTSLSGITRHSVMEIARELGVPLQEQLVPREMLYAADEIFFTGTATEVTPVRSVDGLEVGTGGRGPITRQIQERYLSIARGLADDPFDWLTYVD